MIHAVALESRGVMYRLTAMIPCFDNLPRKAVRVARSILLAAEAANVAASNDDGYAPSIGGMVVQLRPTAIAIRTRFALKCSQHLAADLARHGWTIVVDHFDFNEAITLRRTIPSPASTRAMQLFDAILSAMELYPQQIIHHERPRGP